MDIILNVITECKNPLKGLVDKFMTLKFQTFNIINSNNVLYISSKSMDEYKKDLEKVFLDYIEIKLTVNNMLEVITLLTQKMNLYLMDYRFRDFGKLRTGFLSLEIRNGNKNTTTNCDNGKTVEEKVTEMNEQSWNELNQTYNNLPMNNDELGTPSVLEKVSMNRKAIEQIRNRDQSITSEVLNEHLYAQNESELGDKSEPSELLEERGKKPKSSQTKKEKITKFDLSIAGYVYSENPNRRELVERSYRFWKSPKQKILKGNRSFISERIYQIGLTII